MARLQNYTPGPGGPDIGEAAFAFVERHRASSLISEKFVADISN
jgi:hypothetical protein